MLSGNNRRIIDVPITAHEELGDGLHVLTIRSAYLASLVKPGQFLNIRIVDATEPLLRRPFSVSRVTGDDLEILFNIVGRGTGLLAVKKLGSTLNVIGPLGVPFHHEADFETAIMVAGGLGVAPFPFLTSRVLESGKRVETFLGARSASQLIQRNLRNVHIATDDGSKGFHGTVVTLLEQYLNEQPVTGGRIFACGPTKMMKALSEFAQAASIPCELSLEGDMACGIGICQGCPVETTHGPKKFALVCTDGPAFDCKDVVLY